MLDSIWKNIFHKQNDEELINILANIPIFEGLNPKEIKKIKHKLHLRTYGHDEVIFEEQQPGSGMYIIQKGTVDILLTRGFKEPKSLAKYGIGDFFGELALLDESPRSASAIAREPNTILMGFFRADLVSMLDTDPVISGKIFFNLAKILGKRLRESNTMLRTLQCND